MDDLNLMVSINRYNIYIYISYTEPGPSYFGKAMIFQFGGFWGAFFFSTIFMRHKEGFCSQCADSGADHCHRDFDEVARYEATGTLKLVAGIGPIEGPWEKNIPVAHTIFVWYIYLLW